MVCTSLRPLHKSGISADVERSVGTVAGGVAALSPGGSAYTY